MTCGSAMTLYCFENSFLGLVSCGTFSDSWHISFPTRILDFSAYWRQLTRSREASPQFLNKTSYYFPIYLQSSRLAVLAVAPVITAELPIRLRRLALLPLIR